MNWHWFQQSKTEVVSVDGRQLLPKIAAYILDESFMSSEIERAVKYYEQACLAEAQNRLELAETNYLKSANLFQQAGMPHFPKAAKVLNTLSFLRERRGNYRGALCAAKHAEKILDEETVISSLEADQIRLQTWGLIGNLYCQMQRYCEAEQVLQRTLEYALLKFGNENEEVTSARNHLAILYQQIGEPDKAEKLYLETLASLTVK